MQKITKRLVTTLVLGAGLHVPMLHAQNVQPAQQTVPPLEVGAVAPDFELPGATRYGMLRDPVRLSDFKGKTVVLAFFFKARTKG